MSRWVGANFDLYRGALRSFRELSNQPMYFNESYLQCGLLGRKSSHWHSVITLDALSVITLVVVLMGDTVEPRVVQVLVPVPALGLMLEAY